MSKVKLFGIGFDNYDFDDLLAFMDRAILAGKPCYILTCNVDHLMKLQQDAHFRDVYSQATAVVADGMPIVWASRLLRTPLKQRVAGSDIMPKLGRRLAKRGYRIFLLGAAEGVADKARLNLEAKYPEINIVGTYSPSYGFESNEAECRWIISMLRSKRPDIVLVGAGAPKQEKWIHRHYRQYGAPISIGVGAALDYMAGEVKRAPVFLQRSSLEWLWRLIQEPRRLWRRYLLDDMKFLGLLLRELRVGRGEKR
ncbi:WecB/TagA/CpsF family glycosyltransferase [Cohnella thailandensis]|uniref:WecB/TagA/CpsF family glycosyltransferase n=1 Tax=Cohnella thailandensis TaxID=557557 RepID=A0A841SZR8_9BACL|nr:WecB/TagA/CpsF family glycosyltransferase [Cohnella thailandensis]MBB6635127.1 WecB/TagA/CpsF family glycosyltransferase [Cohnella thailandensis]MBP1974407.1 N-acetylglucosaminyldiphosphoundecaprenol N-acetyl-beta-D-mannosaminyltransferase [Cohnella thailandensis]